MRERDVEGAAEDAGWRVGCAAAVPACAGGGFEGWRAGLRVPPGVAVAAAPGEGFRWTAGGCEELEYGGVSRPCCWLCCLC